MSYSRRPKIGELFHELFVFTEIPWKFSRLHILPANANYDIQSPPFAFAGATWILHVWPYGHAHSDSDGWIDLGIERLDCEIPEHPVFCKFHLKTHRGKEFGPYQASFTFNATCTVDWMMYPEKDDFLRKEKTVTEEDVLTIVCQMRTPKISGIEVLTQTELVEPVAESSEEKSEELEKPTSVCKNCDCVTHHPDNKMVQDFKEFFLKQEDCDVIIKVKGQEFPAHRSILSARSPVFASTFRNDMKERATGIIDIEDCDPSSFLDFLCFLYCGSVESVTTENVFSLFTMADKYDVEDLRLQCLEFMKINLSVDSFCETVTLALQHLEKELIALTTDFFANNLQEIIVTVKWQSFLVANPIQSNEIMIKALVTSKK